MKPIRRITGVLGVLCCLELGVHGTAATVAFAEPDSTAAGQIVGGPATATASAIGLLPVHAIAVDLDVLLKAKDSDFEPLQKLWDSYLKGAGFNVIEFGVDARDLGDGGAGRVAKLCAWAKQNNVRIAPTLIGAPEGKALPADYGKQAASFVGKVIANLGPAGMAAYPQVVFYESDRPLNHPASHGAIESAAAAAILKSAAEDVRAAEQAALATNGLQPTPLLIPASFDYELVKRGGGSQGAVSDETYQQAYEGLRDYTLAVTGAATIEAVSVQWYPGSISSEGVDRLPDLVTRLESDLPGKLLIVDTGFSSAAASDTAQARYYQVALNNLCDLRASQGVESPFTGILWRSAFDGPGADTKATAAKPAAEVLAKVWNDPKADGKEARSWLSNIESHFGLLAREKKEGGGLVPKTAYHVMSSLEAVLSQAPQASDALATVKELSEAAKTGGVTNAVKTKLQNFLFGMMDTWLASTANNLFSAPTEAAPAAGAAPGPQPFLTLYDVGMPAENTPLGTAVIYKPRIKNSGNAMATGVVVYLRQKDDVLATTGSMMIPPGTETVMPVVWTPDSPGEYPNITLQVYCENSSDPAILTDALRHKVENPNGGGGGGKPTGPKGAAADAASAKDKLMAESTKTPPKKPPIGGSDDPGKGTSKGGATRESTARKMSTQTDAGFASIEEVSAPTMMMASAPAGMSSPTSARTISGAASSIASAAAREPVTMTLTNPFSHVFRDVVASLSVDDVPIAKLALGTVLPGQRRTVAFTQWSPPHPGSYRLRVDLAGKGPLFNQLASSATSTVVIEGAATMTRSVTAPAAAAPAGLRARSISPMIRATAFQPGPGFGKSRGIGFATRPLAATRGIVLTAAGIVVLPSPPRVDAPATVSVQLSNSDPSPVHGVRVALTLDGASLGETVIEVPAAGTAIAGGFKQWTPQAGQHLIRATVAVGPTRTEASKTVIVSGSLLQRLGQPALAAGGTPPAPPTGLKAVLGRSALAADLAVLASDIRFTPGAPSAGAPLTVMIGVRNLGGIVASDGHVLAVLLAGGVEVARRVFDAPVPAHGMLSLSWPLTTPNKLPLMVTATTMVTGDANPANNQARAASAAKPVLKPLIPRSTALSR